MHLKRKRNLCSIISLRQCLCHYIGHSPAHPTFGCCLMYPIGSHERNGKCVSAFSLGEIQDILLKV